MPPASEQGSTTLRVARDRAAGWRARGHSRQEQRANYQALMRREERLRPPPIEIRHSEDHVAHYLGNGVLAYFGYRRDMRTTRRGRYGWGLQLVERIGALDAGQPLQIAGLVVVGDLIGTGKTQERGAIGETPNLADRLQAIAPPNGVLIDETTTQSLVRDLFDYRDLGQVETRGSN